MSETRLPGGAKANICTVCNGLGQERLKSSDLPSGFNVAGGRYEGDLFIRKCITCDGLGAIEDAMQYMNQKYETSQLQNNADLPQRITAPFWHESDPPSIFGPLFKIFG